MTKMKVQHKSGLTPKGAEANTTDAQLNTFSSTAVRVGNSHIGRFFSF